ncbi:MAG TPA: hypothetical protein VL137_08390 [Polyangiaceae bacterium]|nr:hypothetical protein [Polyangiaceae bacterium]
MSQSKPIDRKLFLTWTVTSVGAAVFGCSSDPAADQGMGGSTAVGGSGGMGGSGGGAGGHGGSATGVSGSGGTSVGGTGGSGGNAVGGSGGSGGGAGGAAGSGGAGGAGGASGGAGGAGAMNCGEAGTAQALSSWITLNHGHVLEVSMADVTAGVTKGYDTQGISMHTHWIELTAADFATLQAGGTVHKYSCNDDHEHEFIVKGGAGVMACDTDKTLMHIADTCFPVGAPMRSTCGDADGNFCM